MVTKHCRCFWAHHCRSEHEVRNKRPNSSLVPVDQDQSQLGETALHLSTDRVQEQKAGGGGDSTKTLQALFQNAISQSIKMLCKQKSSFPSTPHLLINMAGGCVWACPTFFLTRHGFVRSKECYLITSSDWNSTSNPQRFKTYSVIQAPIQLSFSTAAAFQILQQL